MTTITAGLVTLLNADATLTGFAPGKAWLDIAPAPTAATRPVVVVSLLQSPLEETMCPTVVRRFQFAVSVEGTQTQAATVRSAAARIDTLLHRTTWTASGWSVVRSSFVDVTERAAVDGDARLLTITGRLEVVAQRA